MLYHDDGQIVVAHDGGGWVATHVGAGFGGPASLSVGDDELLRATSFYIDDMGEDAVVATRCKAYHQGGAAVVETGGYLPFGGEVKVAQTCRYAANAARITFDLSWKRGSEIKRHFGLGALFLPGTWSRYYCLPPASHLAAGQAPDWHVVPAGQAEVQMIGHWHRPPLALVFERPDGTRLEVGTGSDLWRWEQCLGYGPEAGSYKVMVEADGIRLIREPLMCCEPFAPQPRAYRFKWHLAWEAAADRALPEPESDGTLLEVDKARRLRLPDDASGPFVLDIGCLPFPDSVRRYPSLERFLQQEPEACPCWQAPATMKYYKGIIRQLAGHQGVADVVIRGIKPGPCVDPGHLQRRRPEGLAHWDMTSLLDAAVWTRRQLGEQRQIHLGPMGPDVLPSVRQLFSPNGFDAHVETPEDDA